MLQLLCEGHNSRMQNYMRHQLGNIRHVDLVTLTAQLMHVMVEEINTSNIDVLVQVRHEEIVLIVGLRSVQREYPYHLTVWLMHFLSLVSTVPVHHRNPCFIPP